MDLSQVAQDTVLKGTFLQELFETIEAGNFTDIEIESEVDVEEEVVGTAYLRIPYIGWLKIWFAQLIGG